MRLTIIGIIIIIVVTSCHTGEQKLVGSWRHVVEIDTTEMSPPDGRRYSHVLAFINDSLVDTKQPHFRITQTDSKQASKYGFERKYEFIGTVTKYRVSNDSIYIYNRHDSTWMGGSKIVRVSPNKMILRSSEKDSEYVKIDYKLSDLPDADQIVLSTSGCYGSCPKMNIVIKTNGDVLYYGEMFSDKIGYYRTHIPPEQFREIEEEFRKSNYKSLAKHYSVHHTDDETISTTFLKRDTIITSVKDYGGAGPDDLVWAYPYLRYLSQRLDLVSIDSTECNLKYPFTWASFEDKNVEATLTQSESFLLSIFVNHAIQIKTVPADQLKYKLQIWSTLYSEDSPPEILTDGRYFNVKYKGKPVRSLDIGFNFLETHAKIIEFNKKGTN